MASIDGTSGLQAPLLRRPPASCALARSCLLSLQRRAARPLVALLVAGIVLLVAVCGAHASPRPATNHGTATLDASALHTSTSGSASADELSISASMAVKGGIFDTTTGLDDIRSFIGFDYINASLATTLQAGVPSPLPLIAELDVLSNLASSKEFVWAYSDLSPSTASWLQQTSGDLHGFPIHALAPCQAIQGPFVSDRLENRAYQLGGVQAYESVVPPPTTVYSPFSLYAPFVLINGSDTHAGCSATEMVRIYLGANRTFTQPVAGLLLFGLDGDASVDAAMQAPYPGDPGQTPLFRIPNDLAGKLVHAMWTASALSASLLDSQATRAPTAASQILDPNEQRSNYGMTVHDLSRVMIAAPSNVSNTLEAPNLAFSAEPLVAIRLHMRVGTIASPADLAQFSATWKVIVPIVIILLSLLAVTVWLVYRRIQVTRSLSPDGPLSGSPASTSAMTPMAMPTAEVSLALGLPSSRSPMSGLPRRHRHHHSPFPVAAATATGVATDKKFLLAPDVLSRFPVVTYDPSGFKGQAAATAAPAAASQDPEGTPSMSRFSVTHALRHVGVFGLPAARSDSPRPPSAAAATATEMAMAPTAATMARAASLRTARHAHGRASPSPSLPAAPASLSDTSARTRATVHYTTTDAKESSATSPQAASTLAAHEAAGLPTDWADPADPTDPTGPDACVLALHRPVASSGSTAGTAAASSGAPSLAAPASRTATAAETAVVVGGDDDPVCAVCLEGFVLGDVLRLLPCHHVFHQSCVDKWLTTQNCCCPLCRWDASQ